ncbi:MULTISPECIES: multiple cyclophane-containing RiPP AmcA [unclassified Micromonospora]|uniref:multiple cyclophane-containing RiPP AmcA n=1 Tax=unclassified Micromonospora TaxID=2617518 RepID=UPI00272E3BAA|nr:MULTISPECIES: multiple cyclophane-containing RiPP AmcA [unclassified Micromonospora]
MTVYVSRNARADQSGRPESLARVPAWQQARPADPPLLTHVWRRLFEQQAREGDRR